MASAPAVSVSGLGKTYRLGAATSAPPQLRRPRCSGCAPPASPSTRSSTPSKMCPSTSLRGGGGHRGPQRRREVDPAQAPDPSHRSHTGPHRAARPGGLAPGGRHRLPPGAHRQGEHLPQRLDPRDEPPGDQKAVRRDCRVLRHREIPCHPRQTLFIRNAGTPGLLRRSPSGHGDPRHRRGPGRRRRRIPETIHRQDA